MICYPVGWRGCGGRVYSVCKGSRKKSYFLNASATKALTPPPSSLMAVGTFKKNLQSPKESFFSS